jgi:hypothetical protein
MQKIRPDNHQLALAEILAIFDGLGNGLTAPCADITKGAQADADRRERGRHFLRIETRHAENARLNAGDRFGSQQRLEAGVFTVLIRVPPMMLEMVCARVFSGTFGNAQQQ